MNKNRSVTISDIAKTAKVSKSTVSRVLNDSESVKEKKRKAVLAAMEQLNFKPNIFARSLAGGKSLTVGIVTQNIGSPFYDLVTQGILRAMHGTNYSPLFVDGQWDERVESAAIKTLMERQVDGLIVVGGYSSEQALNQIKDSKPIVIVARNLEGWKDRCIHIDNQYGAFLATEYLIRQGHQRIAHITGIKDHQDSIDRRAGYEQALKQAGLDIIEELIVEGNFNAQSGVLATESLLMSGKNFTSIFAANDEMAFGARLALYRRGVRVPDEMSLVGFDNQPNSAYQTPPLTTIEQPAVQMGSHAATVLLSLLAGNEPELIELEPRLVVRESVKLR